MPLNRNIFLMRGIHLMRRLTLPVKLTLMGLMLVLPLLVITVRSYQAARVNLVAVETEAEGARWVAELNSLIAKLQNHRGLTARVQAGDKSAEAARELAREKLAQALREQEALAAQTQLFVVPTEWAALRSAVQELVVGRMPVERAAAFALHVELVRQAWRVQMTVAEVSGLLLDPVAETYYLMDIAVQRIALWGEPMAIMRGQGAALLATGTATPPERSALLSRADTVQQGVDDVAWLVGALQRADTLPLRQWEAARLAGEQFVQRARQTFSAESLSGTPAEYFDAGSAALKAVNLLAEEVNTRLLVRLQERADQTRRAMWTDLALAISGLLLVSYLAIAFYVSFSGGLTALRKGMDAVADGDLSHRFVIRGRDEMAQIGVVVERMNERMSAMVAKIRSSAARVGMSGTQVADGSKALSQRTEEQASGLRQTLATVQSLSEAVAANAAAAADLDNLSGGLRREAEAGSQEMRDTVQGMAQMESSSKRVAEIIAVIDGIAFQTNILALNAAVEAARAGESGRGFAVVASEVRLLAKRSSTAAGEIRQLIGQSGEQVSASTQRIQHAGQMLDGLVVGVRSVSDALRTIAAASARQSADLEEVTQGVGNLDEITRQNALMVEESSSASQDLVARAQMLSGAVASIRLRQGSADEAQALVERALVLIRASSLAAASAELHSKDSGFVDRDLYIFLIDQQGVYRLHGASPKMEGRPVREVPGIDGERFLRDAWEAAAKGSGWIEYEIQNQQTGTVQAKASFIARLDAKTLIGCGFYQQI
jgi:methyl-accepting chemotaxis protein